MKKKFWLISVISTVVVTCLLAGSVVQAAPTISVEKSVSVSDDGSNPDEGDAEPGPIFNEGDTIYFVYSYSITNNSTDAMTYDYVITDSDPNVGEITNDTPISIAAGGTVTGIAQVLGKIAQPGQYDSIVEMSVTSEVDDAPTPATDPLFYYGIPAAEEITIDIKPGSDTNPINLRSQGVVPVALIDFVVDPDNPEETLAILGEEGTVITFAGAEALRWAVEDVDGDGFADDVICHFKTQDLGELNEESNPTVEISTFDDTAQQQVTSYTGSDEDGVNIVPEGNAYGHTNASANASSSSNKGGNGNKGNNGNKGGNGKNKNQ